MDHQQRNIDRELEAAKEAYTRRKMQIMNQYVHQDYHDKKKQRKKLGKKSRLFDCCCNNLQIFKYLFILFAIIGTLFASILLTIAGDAQYNQGTIYQYNDLIRLVLGIHHNLLDIQSAAVTGSNANNNRITTTRPSTPSESSSIISRLTIEKRDIQSQLNELFHFDKLKQLARSGKQKFMKLKEHQFGQWLQQWLPIKHSDYQSNDPILDDSNFYYNNYKTFQTIFIILILISNFLLFITWLLFKLIKNFRNHYQQLSNENDEDSQQNSKKNCCKHFLKQQFKDFCNRKHRLLLIWLLFQLFLIIMLLCRPNFFLIILHQISFLLLSVSCLASTSLNSSKSFTKPISVKPNDHQVITNQSTDLNRNKPPSISNDGRFKIDARIPSISEEVTSPSASIQLSPGSVQLPSLKISSKQRKHHRHHRQQSITEEHDQHLHVTIGKKSNEIKQSENNDAMQSYPDDKNPFEISVKNPLKEIKIQNPISIETKTTDIRIQQSANNLYDDKPTTRKGPIDISIKNPIILHRNNDENEDGKADNTEFNLSLKNPINEIKDSIKQMEVKLPKIDPSINVSLPKVSLRNPINISYHKNENQENDNHNNADKSTIKQSDHYDADYHNDQVNISLANNPVKIIKSTTKVVDIKTNRGGSDNLMDKNLKIDSPSNIIHVNDEQMEYGTFVAHDEHQMQHDDATHGQKHRINKHKKYDQKQTKFTADSFSAEEINDDAVDSNDVEPVCSVCSNTTPNTI